MSWLPELAGAWWSWTAAVSTQVCVVALAALALDKLLARFASARARVALWLVVVLKLVVPPTLSSPVSVAQLAEPASPAAAVAAAPLPASATAVLVLFAVWAAGVVAFGVALAVRYRRVRGAWLGLPIAAPPPGFDALLRRCAARLALPRAPRVELRTGARGPAVIGSFRPRVVLPAELVADEPEERVEHVLLHELAHVKRRDPLAAAVCVALQVLYWFHPVAWLVRARLATLREIAVDEAVARALGATPAYRRTLLELARPLLARPAVAPVLGENHGFTHRHSQLMARLEWLERPLRRPSAVRRTASSLVLSGIVACCVPLAPVPPPPFTFSVADLPPYEELEGCMQKRLYMFGLLQSLQAESSAQSHSEGSR